MALQQGQVLNACNKVCTAFKRVIQAHNSHTFTHVQALGFDCSREIGKRKKFAATAATDTFTATMWRQAMPACGNCYEMQMQWTQNTTTTLAKVCAETMCKAASGSQAAASVVGSNVIAAVAIALWVLRSPKYFSVLLVAAIGLLLIVVVVGFILFLQAIVCLQQAA